MTKGKTTIGTKPVVLIFPWLGATENAVSKYVKLYQDLLLDCDIVVKEVQLFDFLWPSSGIRNCKNFLVKLETEMFSCDRPVIIHSMSVGCYFYAIMLFVLKHNPKEFSKIRKNIAAQIVDSPVTGSLNEMASGVSTSSTSSKLGQNLLKHITLLYFASTKFCTVKLYNKFIDILTYQCFIVPSLVMSSLDDPLSLSQTYHNFVGAWSNRNANVTSKFWETSVHAQHFRYHKDEYVSLLRHVLDQALHNNSIPSKL